MFSRIPNKVPRSLSAKLTFWYSSALILLLLTAMAGMFFAVGSILDERMDEDLQEDLDEFRQLYHSEGLASLTTEIQREAEGNDPESFFIRLIDTQGELVFASDQTSWQALIPASQMVSQIATTQISEDKLILEVLYLNDQPYPARTAFGSVNADLYLHIGESMEEKAEIMDVLLIVSLFIFCVIIPCASLVGWYMANRAVGGIREVSMAAADIKNGLLDRRAKVRTQGDEVAELADTFNAMAERIRTLIAEMREMTDNIAHDLRSPLARIRAIAEVTLTGPENLLTYQKAAEDTLEECDRLMQMINTTLDVAEAEAGVGNNQQEDVNLTELAHEACDLFEPVAAQKSIMFNVSLTGQYKVMGNKQNLQRMLANLIDNALKYTPEQGEVSVEVTGRESGVTIAVADTGIGIPKAEQERVFERFYRCDHSRTQEGCGLGLSFSRAVARAHGGEITLQHQESKSSVFTVILPAA